MRFKRRVNNGFGDSRNRRLILGLLDLWHLVNSSKKYSRSYGHVWRASRKAGGEVVKRITFNKKNPNQVFTYSDIEERIGTLPAHYEFNVF